MADMASERQIRDGGGVATESAILGDRWSEAAGSALYWQNFRAFAWLVDTPQGLYPYVWRFYPKAAGFPLGLIVDELPSRTDDDSRLLGGALRRDAAAAEASRRSDAAAAAGIGYVATFIGEQSDAQACVAAAREKVAAIGVQPSDERMPTPDADPGAYVANPDGNDGVTGGLKISGLGRRPTRGEG